MKKDEFLSTLPQKLLEYDNFLETRKWFAGDNISFVDFIMYDRLDWMRYFNVESVVKCTNLLAFLKRLCYFGTFDVIIILQVYSFFCRFEKLPKIEEYYNSAR